MLLATAAPVDESASALSVGEVPSLLVEDGRLLPLALLSLELLSSLELEPVPELLGAEVTPDTLTPDGTPPFKSSAHVREIWYKL